eukprot:81641-Chlamydomonas_euryale.AAC.14
MDAGMQCPHETSWQHGHMEIDWAVQNHDHGIAVTRRAAFSALIPNWPTMSLDNYNITMKNPATSQQVLANALPASELTAP